MASDPAPASRFQRAWWWAADYAYAAGRQLAVLEAPWSSRLRSRTPPSWASGKAGLPEVILLPGVYEHWTFLRPLADDLNAAGYRVSVVHGLRANRRGVAETAERLGRALARTPAPEPGRVLVAHSKGGLIGKQLLLAAAAPAATATAAADAAASASALSEVDEPGAPPLDLLGMVAVCTPFGGSRLARLLWDPSIRAFLPTDETIVMLGHDTSVNARIVSIFGRFDPHIPDGSVLAGATNVRVSGAGHFRVLGQPETHRAVRDGIALLTAPPKDAAEEASSTLP